MTWGCRSPSSPTCCCRRYDFLRLNLDHGCTLQLGGSDQWGNITVGTELVRKVDRSIADGLTSPLFLRADGQKFGKSEGGNEQRLARRLDDLALRAAPVPFNTDDAIDARRCCASSRSSTTTTILELDEATRRPPRSARAACARQRGRRPWCTATTRRASAERAGEALFGESIADLDEATLLEVVADAPSSTWSRDEAGRRASTPSTCWCAAISRRPRARRVASSTKAASTSTTCVSTARRVDLRRAAARSLLGPSSGSTSDAPRGRCVIRRWRRSSCRGVAAWRRAARSARCTAMSAWVKQSDFRANATTLFARRAARATALRNASTIAQRLHTRVRRAVHATTEQATRRCRRPTLRRRTLLIKAYSDFGAAASECYGAARRGHRAQGAGHAARGPRRSRRGERPDRRGGVKQP